jgi:ATP-dependent Clp protease ATP-binding subunit ClpA
MGIFRRYTEAARRAIFFAAAAALGLEADEIEPEHLLLGMLYDKGSRVDSLFHLRTLLPEFIPSPAKLKNPSKSTKRVPLSKDAKRVLVYVAIEADRLVHYWIETEHIVLGILRLEGSAAKADLERIGLALGTAREIVRRNEHSAENGAVPLLWRLVSRLERLFAIRPYE